VLNFGRWTSEQELTAFVVQEISYSAVHHANFVSLDRPVLSGPVARQFRFAAA